MKKSYVTPNMNANRGTLRCSILAGSNSSNFAPGRTVETFSVNASETTDVQLARKKTFDF